MKSLRSIALLLAGIALGYVLCVGVIYVRRVLAVKSLPSLADRTHRPLVDELASITLVRRGEQIDLVTVDGTGSRRGTTRPELETWLTQERQYWPVGHQFVVAISFEPGVTIADLEATLEYLHTLGVDRYFIGGSYYGKFVP